MKSTLKQTMKLLIPLLKSFSMVTIISTLVLGGLMTQAQDDTATSVTAEKKKDNWEYFRGNALSQGVAQSNLPEKPELLWEFEVKEGDCRRCGLRRRSRWCTVCLESERWEADLEKHYRKWFCIISCISRRTYLSG